MALLDAQTLLSDAQAVTATANSTNSYDKQVPRDLAPGGDITLLIICNQTATAAGAATVTFALVEADDAALSVNPTVVLTTPAFAKTALVIGWKYAIELPRLTAVGLGGGTGTALGQRYIGLTYTVATGPLTAGKFTADFVLEAVDDSNKFYPRAGFGVA